MPTAVTFGSTLATASRGISNASVPAGSVLQMTSVIGLSEVAVSSGTLTSVGSLSITPLFSTSKILVLATTVVHRDTGGNSGYYWAGYMYKTTATNGVSQMCDAALYQSGGDGFRQTITAYYVDSPGSTSTLTYGISGARQSGSTSATFNKGNVGHIIIMEIAQ